MVSGSPPSSFAMISAVSVARDNGLEYRFDGEASECTRRCVRTFPSVVGQSEVCCSSIRVRDVVASFSVPHHMNLHMFPLRFELSWTYLAAAAREAVAIRSRWAA